MNARRTRRSLVAQSAAHVAVGCASRFARRAVALACALAALLCGGSARAQQPRAWEPLFDGRTLDGWSGDRAYWSAEDGCIVGRSSAQHPLEHTLYLTRADRVHADFELELEFELQGGNSGVQLRSELRSDGDVAGLQADLEDGPSWTGGLYDQDGRGVLVRRGEQVHARADGSRDVLAIGDSAELQARVRVHAWNSYRIVARGPLVEVYLNGARTSSLLDEDAAHARASGVIALQLHSGAPMQVRFRDVRVRELGSSGAAKPDADARDPSVEAPLAAHWIWAHAESRDGEAVVLRKRFALEQPTTWIRGRIRADNAAVVSIDGALVARNDAWWEPTAIDVQHALEAGPHELVIEASNEGSIGAVLGEWSFDDDARPRLRVWTDASFEATLAEGSRARAAHDFGDERTEPWASAAAGMKAAAERVDEPLPDPARFALPAGFRAQLVYAVPRARQGSWVSLCRAPGHKLYAGDQYGSIWCVTLAPAASVLDAPRVASVERVELPLVGAQGLVWAHDSLYVVANSSKSGLYRCRDTNADGVLDDARLLRAFDGDGEHGPHAVLANASDGKLYVVIGNHTQPTQFARSLVPTSWGEDQLLKHRNDPNGHAVGVLAPGGWIARCDPDGKEFELVACGFRNTYDAAFDARGELFTYDADMEWDVGLPWYRPTRILHVVPGADYGWRNGNAKWPAWVPDSLPSAVDLGPGSPTGVLHGHELTQFPRAWRERLYAADWSYGRVWAVDLLPRGASYRGEARAFLKGRPLPVTDLEAGEDGSLYVTSGGRDTPSGLWRVVWTGARDDESPIGDARLAAARSVGAQPLAAQPGAAQTDAARVVERDATRAVEPLADDPFALHAARIERELHASMTELAHASLDGARGIRDAIACLHRSKELADTARDAYWARLVAYGIGAQPELVRDRLRVLELAWIRLGPVPESQRAALHALLDEAERGGNSDYERVHQALELMCVSRHPNAVAMGMIRIDCATDAAQRIAYAQALAETDVGWDENTRTRLARWIRTTGSHAGGASYAKYVTGIVKDVVAASGLAPELVKIDVPSASAVAASSSTSAGAAASGKDWTLDELEPLLAGIVGARNHARGRELYTQVTCAACHRIAGAGGSTGPDLSGAGSRFSLRALAENVVQPSRVISDQYRDTVFELEGGGIETGRVLAEDAQSVRVLLTGLPERERTFDVASIASRRVSGVSRMPENLLRGLSADDVRDLFAYVLAGGDASDPVFQ